jgi:hypothetical protein
LKATFIFPAFSGVWLSLSMILLSFSCCCYIPPSFTYCFRYVCLPLFLIAFSLHLTFYSFSNTPALSFCCNIPPPRRGFGSGFTTRTCGFTFMLPVSCSPGSIPAFGSEYLASALTYTLAHLRIARVRLSLASLIVL